MRAARLACLAASLAACLLPCLPTLSRAAVDVERHGEENPVQEVAKSTLWGALAGLVVGGAIELAASDGSGEPIRWGIVAGTAVGLVAGIYFVSTRPSATALLELDQGHLGLAPPTVEPSALGGTNVRLFSVRF